MTQKRSIHFGHIIIILILIIIAMLAFCFRDRIFTTGSPGEGSLLVTGQGVDMYYVFGAKDNQKINFTYTGRTMNLPAGHYRVILNNTETLVTIRTNKKSEVHSGMLVIEGTGQNLYEIWDEKSEIKLDFRYTGRGSEFFSGIYTIILNGVHKKVTVFPGDTSRVATGRLSVTGKPGVLYYIYDEVKRHQLQFTSVGKETEMLPGTYLVRVDENEQHVKIRVGELTTVEFH